MLTVLLVVSILVISIGLTVNKNRKDLMNSFCYSECINVRNKLEKVDIQKIF